MNDNENESKLTSTILYGGDNNDLTQTNNYENPPFNSDIPQINELEYPNHYLCPKCLLFPFIEFCKDMKHIKLTCSCYNNKKILIKDLLDEKNKYIIIEDSITNLLSSIDRNLDCEGIKCTKHNKKMEYFCKKCFGHCCNENNCCDPIKLEEIRFDNKKIELLKNKINSNSDKITEDMSNLNLNDTKIINNNNSNTEILTRKEKDQFNKLINIIINDYCNFPNILHFFNIQNLFNFFILKMKMMKMIKMLRMIFL